MSHIRYKAGGYYFVPNVLVDGEKKNLYIIAHIGGRRVKLINVFTGSPWSDSTIVKKIDNITRKEFKRICGYSVSINDWKRKIMPWEEE